MYSRNSSRSPGPESMEHYFDILAPPGGVTISLVIHVPHSSTEVPEKLRHQFALTDDELDTELLAMTNQLFTRS